MINNIKNLVDNGNISEAISQISPEMIQNFSQMMNNTSNINTKSNSTTDNDNLNFSTNSEPNNPKFKANHSTNKNVNKNHSDSNNNIPSFDLNNLDMNTIMKISSAFNKINSKDDQRANLLYSLKPYLRDSRKDKLDQYVNLLNITKIAEILKDDKDNNKKN